MMLSIRQAKKAIDINLWNTLKKNLVRDLHYYKEAPHDPYDPDERYMHDLSYTWFYEPIEKARAAFLKELIIRYRNHGGRFVGEEDKPTPPPLRIHTYKLDNNSNQFIYNGAQDIEGVSNPPKQLDLFKDEGDEK